MPEITEIKFIAANGSINTISESSLSASMNSNTGSVTRFTVKGSHLDLLESIKVRFWSYTNQEGATFELVPAEGGSDEEMLFTYTGEEDLGNVGYEYLIVNGRRMWVINSPYEGNQLTLKVHDDFSGIGNVYRDSTLIGYPYPVRLLEGDPVTISAVPKTGYAFDHWSDGNTDAVRTITIDEDTVMQAFFKPGDDESLIDEPLVMGVKITANGESMTLDHTNPEATITIPAGSTASVELTGARMDLVESVYVDVRDTDSGAYSSLPFNVCDESEANRAVFSKQFSSGYNAVTYLKLSINSKNMWSSNAE